MISVETGGEEPPNKCRTVGEADNGKKYLVRPRSGRCRDSVALLGLNSNPKYLHVMSMPLLSRDFTRRVVLRSCRCSLSPSVAQHVAQPQYRPPAMPNLF